MSARLSSLRIGDSSAHFSALVDAAIDRALEERRLVGAVALVALHGEVVYRRAAGTADREAFTNTLYEGMCGRFVTDLCDAVYGTLGAAR